jgi:Ca-activated chloride channel family protein
MFFAAALATPAQQEQPLIQVTSRLIEVSVVVQEDGKFVGGLTRDDFELLDEGKRREIAFFSAESTKAVNPP